MILLGLSVPTCLYIAYRGTMYITSASSSSTVLWAFYTIQPFIFIYDGTEEFNISKTRHCPVRPSMPQLTRYHNHFKLSCITESRMKCNMYVDHRTDVIYEYVFVSSRASATSTSRPVSDLLVARCRFNCSLRRLAVDCRAPVCVNLTDIGGGYEEPPPLPP